jgi:hypothetical protein
VTLARNGPRTGLAMVRSPSPAPYRAQGAESLFDHQGAQAVDQWQGGPDQGSLGRATGSIRST